MATGIHAALATDNFAVRPDLNSVYTLHTGQFQVSSNLCNDAQGGGILSDIVRNAEIYSNNQYAIIIVNTVASGAATAGVIVRATNNGGWGYYKFYTDGATGSGHCALAVFDQGSGVTEIQAFGSNAPGNGDTICLEAIGTTIRCFKNGTQLGTDQISSYWTQGTPGLMGVNNGIWGSAEFGNVIVVPATNYPDYSKQPPFLRSSIRPYVTVSR